MVTMMTLLLVLLIQSNPFASTDTLCIQDCIGDYNHINGQYTLQHGTHNGDSVWKQTCPENGQYIYAAIYSGDARPYWQISTSLLSAWSYDEVYCQDPWRFDILPPDPTQCTSGGWRIHGGDTHVQLTIASGSCPSCQATPEPTHKPTPIPTVKPTIPTPKPTPIPTKKPSPGPTRRPSINPMSKPTTATPTQPGTVTCGDSVVGVYSGGVVMFTIFIPFFGDLIFDATGSNFPVTHIEAYTASDASLSTDRDHDERLKLRVPAGEYKFGMTGNGESSSLYHVVISCVSDAPTPYPSKAPSTGPPTRGPTPSPSMKPTPDVSNFSSMKPVIKPTPDSSNSPTQRPTEYVTCGDTITGNYNDESVILTVQMAYDGMLIFDAMETPFQRVHVEQINDLGQVLEHREGKSLTLSNVKAANYKFKMFTEGYARGTFTVKIHCVESDVFDTTDDHHSTTGIDKAAFKSKTNQGMDANVFGNDTIGMAIAIMVTLICCLCGCLVAGCVYIRKNRDAKPIEANAIVHLPSNTHVHGAVQMMPGAVEPPPHAPFRTYTEEINGESMVPGVPGDGPNNTGNSNDALYDRAMLDNYANIQMEESSSSGEDINPVLVTPMRINQRHNENLNVNYNPNANENKPFHHESPIIEASQQQRSNIRVQPVFDSDKDEDNQNVPQQKVDFNQDNRHINNGFD